MIEAEQVDVKQLAESVYSVLRPLKPVHNCMCVVTTLCYLFCNLSSRHWRDSIAGSVQFYIYGTCTSVPL